MTRKLILSISLILMGLCRFAVAGTVSFKPAQNYPVGTNPVAVVAADFNGDGKMDLAVVNSGDASANDNGGVSILLGNGDGTFQSAVTVAAGNNPGVIAAGDFNGDSHLDLVVADSGGVTVLLGNGDGTFQGPVGYPAPQTGITSVAVRDLNGDKRLDLVVSGSVLLGNGDGSFESPVNYAPAGASGIADFNGDDKMDLAAPNGTKGVTTLLGNGDGTFQPGWTSARLSVWALEVMVGDFNGDGKPDLIVQGVNFGNATASGVVLLLGNGDGTFSQGNGLSGACRNYTPVAADFDGDGKLDLAIFANDNCFPSPRENPRILVIAGNGDGTFQTPISLSASRDGFLGMAVDLDGNKTPDLVAIASSAPNSISVLLNAVSTDFSISASAISPATVSPGQIATSTVSLNLRNAFDNPVSLACSVQPTQAGAPTCSLSSNSVTFDGSGQASATLTINAGSSVAIRNSFQSVGEGGLVWLPVAGFAFLGTGFGVSISRRRRFLMLPIGAILFVGIIMQTACGGGSGVPKSTMYTVTITGMSGATQHSTTVNLTAH